MRCRADAMRSANGCRGLPLSVYHRASDLWRIPQLVLELSPDYRLYLRQHDGGIIETVLYALPTAEKRLWHR